MLISLVFNVVSPCIYNAFLFLVLVRYETILFFHFQDVVLLQDARSELEIEKKKKPEKILKDTGADRQLLIHIQNCRLSWFGHNEIWRPTITIEGA